MFLHDFENWQSVRENFKGTCPYDDPGVLLASYGYANYSGDAFVLYQRDGKLYEVNGSHCSCYGLENQWEPEETTYEELLHRYKKGTLGKDEYTGNTFHHELGLVLDSIKPT